MSIYVLLAALLFYSVHSNSIHQRKLRNNKRSLANACSICGEGQRVTAPEGSIFYLPNHGEFDCHFMERGGFMGAFPHCEGFPSLISEACQCEPSTEVWQAPEEPAEAPTESYYYYYEAPSRGDDYEALREATSVPSVSPTFQPTSEPTPRPTSLPILPTLDTVVVSYSNTIATSTDSGVNKSTTILPLQLAVVFSLALTCFL